VFRYLLQHGFAIQVLAAASRPKKPRKKKVVQQKSPPAPPKTTHVQAQGKGSIWEWNKVKGLLAKELQEKDQDTKLLDWLGSVSSSPSPPRPAEQPLPLEPSRQNLEQVTEEVTRFHTFLLMGERECWGKGMRKIDSSAFPREIRQIIEREKHPTHKPTFAVEQAFLQEKARMIDALERNLRDGMDMQGILRAWDRDLQTELPGWSWAAIGKSYTNLRPGRLVLSPLPPQAIFTPAHREKILQGCRFVRDATSQTILRFAQGLHGDRPLHFPPTVVPQLYQEALDQGRVWALRDLEGGKGELFVGGRVAQYLHVIGKEDCSLVGAQCAVACIALLQTIHQR
jgi:hypothetical protein